MSGTPTEILLARALHWLEMASLQLGTGRHTEAAESISKATHFVELAQMGD